MKSLYRHYQSSHPCHQNAKMNSPQDDGYFEANFKKHLPINKQAKIIDIGCGAGYFLQYLEKKGYLNYLGIDVSREQIDFCKKKHLKGKVQLISDLDKFLITKNEEYDLVMINDVIEHLPKEKIIDILRLIRKTLKNHGLLIVKTANMKNRWGAAVRFMDITHTVGFTEESLFQTLYLSGFKNVRIINEIHPIHDIKSFFRVLLKHLFESVYKIEYLISFGTVKVNVSNMLIAIAGK